MQKMRGRKMWEAITSIVTSKNMYQLLIFFVLLVWSIALLAKTGIFYFHNGFLSIGDGERERELIRRQQEWAYNYIMALEKEIKPDTQDDSFGHFFRVAVLERVYDKVVEMIVFNHISERAEYVENKKALFKNTVYKFPIKPYYKTKEFEKKMDKWTEEIIHNLLIIRTLWGKEFQR